jgi:drug/metabolite transporter (DMT)-like permease
VSAPPISAPFAAAAALAAALCWTLASLLWRRLPTSLGAVQLNLLKNLLALALQLPLALALPWQVPLGGLLVLAASGVVGIALGDSFFFAALRRLGTRRTLTIDAGGPAVTTLAGVALLGEVPEPAQWLGVALITGAVLLVASRPPQRAAPGGEGVPLAGGELAVAAEMAASARGEAPHAPAAFREGVLLALAALACGSIGALLARAALRGAAVPPLQAATLRLAAASLVMLPLLRGFPLPGRRPRLKAWRWPRLLLATLLGTSFGISLQQTALAGLPGGLAVALLGTAPVMALPLAWWIEGDRPGWRGLVAAPCALAGVALVVLTPVLGSPAG